MVFPQYRTSKPIHIMKRCTYGDAPPNECMELIRENEIKNPAPFGDRVLVIDTHRKHFTLPSPFRTTGKGVKAVYNVPIAEIYGIHCQNNLDNFEIGKTFREVLFESLHGHSFTQESLDYFLDDRIKDNRRGFDQDERCRDKAYGRGGIRGQANEHGFYIDNGKQRTIAAMFWIYQNEGELGLLKRIEIDGL